jgi:NADH pyrophosphatase NudC (nudix superfamily)
VREELGIDVPLKFVGKFFSADDREMVGVFVGTHDGPFEVEPLEVAQIKFFTPDELERDLPRMRVTSFVERSLPLLGLAYGTPRS